MTAEKNKDKVKRAIIQSYGDAYRAFGLSKLMGHVVALLIFSPIPLSLDEISEQLSRTKGPVCQIVRRLRDRQLIRKVWHPGSRKDYWEIQPDIFENAFRNNYELIKNNTRIAASLKATVQKARKDVAAKSDDADYDKLIARVKEMEQFYELMEVHFGNFLKEWTERKEEGHAG